MTGPQPLDLAWYSSHLKQNTSLSFSFKLAFACANNIAEYEALVVGLELAIEMNMKNLTVHGDSQLIIKQVLNTYKVKEPHLIPYACKQDEAAAPTVP